MRTTHRGQPRDPKSRDLAHTRFAGNVLTQIALESDTIEMSHATEASTFGRQLLSEASEVRKRLDAIGKVRGYERSEDTHVSIARRARDSRS